VLSSSDPITRIKTPRPSAAAAGLDVQAPSAPLSVKAPSKGPPPLPLSAASGSPCPIEQLFFQEGIDGHAESLPPEGATPLVLDADTAHAGLSFVSLATLDSRWVQLAEEQEEEHEQEEVEVEDPVRIRRRRTARIGMAWGSVVALVLLGVGAFLSHRHEASSVALAPSSASPALSPPVVETTAAHQPLPAPALASTPSQSSPPLPVAALPPAPPSRAPVAAASHTQPLHPAACTASKASSGPCEPRARVATSAKHAAPAGAKGKNAAGGSRHAVTAATHAGSRA
jgi:hypothetical protein